MNPDQILEMLDQLEAHVTDMDLTENAPILFLQALQTSMIDLEVDPDEVIMILEHIHLDIKPTTDRELVQRFAARFAKVISACLKNHSFQALDPVFRRTVLKGLSFSYNA